MGHGKFSQKKGTVNLRQTWDMGSLPLKWDMENYLRNVT